MQAVREGDGKTEYGRDGPEKKFEKNLKKGLTNGPESAIVPIVPLMRRVPCKLNNVTKRKHHTNTVLWNFHEKSGRANGRGKRKRASKKVSESGLSQLPGCGTGQASGEGGCPNGSYGE